MLERLIHPLVIVGGGPAGLLAAIRGSKLSISGLLLEGSDVIGGQIMQLYPSKEIEDLEDTPTILARDYIVKLMSEYEKTSKSIALMKKVQVKNIAVHDEYVELITNKDSFFAKNIIIASGLGAYVPRKIRVPNDNLPEIIYSIDDYAPFKDKNVVVLGGGDSALDGAKMLVKNGAHVTLVHRRNEFRGNAETISGLSQIIIKKPYIPTFVQEENYQVTGITIKHVETDMEETLNCDYIFVNFGFQPERNTFGFERLGAGIKVDDNLKATSRVFVIGDAAGYLNKVRRIYPIHAEIDKVFTQITINY